MGDNKNALHLYGIGRPPLLVRLDCRLGGGMMRLFMVEENATVNGIDYRKVIIRDVQNRYANLAISQVFRLTGIATREVHQQYGAQTVMDTNDYYPILELPTEEKKAAVPPAPMQPAPVGQHFQVNEVLRWQTFLFIARTSKTNGFIAHFKHSRTGTHFTLYDDGTKTDDDEVGKLCSILGRIEEFRAQAAVGGFPAHYRFAFEGFQLLADESDDEYVH